jgi:hypothetical protein
MNGRPNWLRILLRMTAIFVALICGFAIAWAWPKSARHEPSDSIGEYRGFRSNWGTWLLGPRYYRLHRDAYDHDREIGWYETTVEFEAPGYNRFRAFYPSGTLAAQGACKVAWERAGAESIPLFNPVDIKDAEFYKPDGTLAAKVVDGTGTQVHYEPDGLKNWEIEVRDFNWVHYRCWHKNGQLANESRFRDGLWDGPVVGYHDDGTKEYERNYSAGKLVGLSTTYDARGRIHTIEDYDAPDHLKQTDHYDEKGQRVRIEKP